jgi:hypothetical protein
MGLSKKIKTEKDSYTCYCECKEVFNVFLKLILDKETSEKEKDFFYNHVEEYMPCFQKYNMESPLKEFLNGTVKKKEVPASLVSNIQNIISQHTD